MSISTLTDTIYTYRFLKLLVTPFDKMEAYKLGIIDDAGKRIKEKKVSTTQERESFNLFHRIVFNLKRLLGAFPGGKSKIASYAAALGLLREHYDVDLDIIIEELDLDNEHKTDICSLLEEYTVGETTVLGESVGKEIASYDWDEGELKIYKRSSSYYVDTGKFDLEVKSIAALKKELTKLGVNINKPNYGKLKEEEYGTTTSDVADIPKPMKFKSFVKRKDLT
jgi:hypothetical protein